jgi:hypothetical protein
VCVCACVRARVYVVRLGVMGEEGGGRRYIIKAPQRGVRLLVQLDAFFSLDQSNISHHRVGLLYIRATKRSTLLARSHSLPLSLSLSLYPAIYLAA